MAADLGDRIFLDEEGRGPIEAFVAVGLLTSTGLGIWMGLSFGRNKRLLWGLLAAGVVLPLLLVVI